MLSYASDKELFAIMKKELYTAVVGDIMDKMGLQHQFLPPQIRPLKDDMILVGRAMTVQEADLDQIASGSEPGGDFGKMFEALDSLTEDEIYVCSGCSPYYAVFGELMTLRAVYLGAGGAVLNSYLRDTKGILATGIPVFSMGSYAQDQAPRGKVIDYRVPIQFGAVVINPGDILFGDIDGVLVIPQEHEREILEKAYEKATAEKTVAQALMRGVSTQEVFASYGIM